MKPYTGQACLWLWRRSWYDNEHKQCLVY